jgi:membrane-bound ClpP family serine protease
LTGLYIAILIIIGLALLLVEVFFVPGTTIIGILGLLFSAGGVFYAFDSYGATIGYWTLVLTLLGNGYLIYLGLKGNVWQKFANKSAINSRFNDDLEEVPIGMEGMAISVLRPVGTAEFRGKVYEVKSTGAMIEAGTKVRVIRNTNRILIVEVISTENK